MVQQVFLCKSRPPRQNYDRVLLANQHVNLTRDFDFSSWHDTERVCHISNYIIHMHVDIQKALAKALLSRITWWRGKRLYDIIVFESGWENHQSLDSRYIYIYLMTSNTLYKMIKGETNMGSYKLTLNPAFQQKLSLTKIGPMRHRWWGVDSMPTNAYLLRFLLRFST